MNITAFVFLIFAGVVSFINILIGNWHVLFTVVPFIVALLVKGKVSKWAETIGLFVIGLYTIIMGNEYMGFLILFVSTIWFFVYINRGKVAWVYIAIVAVLIGTISFTKYYINTSNRLMATIMDMGFFVVGAVLVLITLNYLAQSIRAEMLKMDKKKLDLIEKLQGALHEAIDTLKTDATDGNKSRTNC